VLCDYNDFYKKQWREMPVTELMEEGTRKIQARIEWMIDVIGSTGKGSEVKNER